MTEKKDVYNTFKDDKEARKSIPHENSIPHEKTLPLTSLDSNNLFNSVTTQQNCDNITETNSFYSNVYIKKEPPDLDIMDNIHNDIEYKVSEVKVEIMTPPVIENITVKEEIQDSGYIASSHAVFLPENDTKMGLFDSCLLEDFEVKKETENTTEEVLKIKEEIEDSSYITSSHAVYVPEIKQELKYEDHLCQTQEDSVMKMETEDFDSKTLGNYLCVNSVHCDNFHLNLPTKIEQNSTTSSSDKVDIKIDFEAVSDSGIETKTGIKNELSCSEETCAELQNRCPNCDKEFSHQSALKRHLTFFCTSKSVKALKSVCNICSDSFKSPFVLQNHMITMHGTGITMKAAFEAKKTTINDAKSSGIANKTKIVSKMSDQTIEKWKKIRKEIPLNDPEENSAISENPSSKPLKKPTPKYRYWPRCKFCYRYFQFYATYHKHVHHECKYRKMIKTKPGIRKEVGPKTIGISNDLLESAEEMTTPEIIDDTTCLQCGRSFSDPTILDTHKTFDCPVFKCGTCNWDTFSLSCIIKHVSVAHDNINILCRTCKEYFSDYPSLKGHLVFKGRRYKCGKYYDANSYCY